MSAVFDSTAIAVWLTGAAGARTVGEILTREEGAISALSVLELAQALPADRLSDLDQLATVEPFDSTDALSAAAASLPHLSIPVLAACVLAGRLGARLVTADPSLRDLDLPEVTVELVGNDD